MGMQGYQLTVQNAKACLDRVICPGTWLMPYQMIINTESDVGYKNSLEQGSLAMQPGQPRQWKAQADEPGSSNVSRRRNDNRQETRWKAAAADDTKPMTEHEMNLAAIIIVAAAAAWMRFR